MDRYGIFNISMALEYAVYEMLHMLYMLQCILDSLIFFVLLLTKHKIQFLCFKSFTARVTQA